MVRHTNEDMVLALQDAPVDHRTGNKVIYSASWVATGVSMIGKRNEDWVRREIDWFVSASNNLNHMEPPVPQAFLDCAGQDGTVNSAYGHILFSNDGEDVPGGVSLAQRILNTFKEEGRSTRHAVAIISDRDVHTLYRKNGRRDFICTNALNVMIDSSDRLHIIAQMRSMDAVWGYRADYSMWAWLQQYLLDSMELIGFHGVSAGDITFQVANLHVYPRHFKLLAEEADRTADELDRRMRQVWIDRDQLRFEGVK